MRSCEIFIHFVFLSQIMREIQEHKIKIYEFSETNDEEENKLVKKIKVRFLSLFCLVCFSKCVAV